MPTVTREVTWIKSGHNPNCPGPRCWHKQDGGWHHRQIYWTCTRSVETLGPRSKILQGQWHAKLVGKFSQLGEGARWVFKLMSQLYTSLAFALKSNTELLEKTSKGFRDLVKQIKTKNFSCKPSDQQHHIKFAMKKAAKIINKNSHLYLVNPTMQDELNFISHAQLPNSGIKFETAIVLLIPRMPTATITGNSSLVACSGYSIKLKFWWHLTFPKKVVEKTLLYLKDNLDTWFIAINCLDYVTIILNYCASLVAFATFKVNDDPHLVVLCVTDNTSALNWTLHTSKKSMIGRALARFFCGLLIGSNVRVNAKWISTSKCHSQQDIEAGGGHLN